MLKSEMRWATSVVFAEYKETKGRGKTFCDSSCCSMDCSAGVNAVGACFRRRAHWKLRVWLSFTLVSCKWDRVWDVCTEVQVAEWVSTTGSRKGSLVTGSEEESLDQLGWLEWGKWCDSVESESIDCIGEIGEKCMDVWDTSDFRSSAASVASRAISWGWYELTAF